MCLSLTAERRLSELRQEGRTLSGVLLRYGDTAALPWGRERFEPGAFGDVSRADVILNSHHEKSRPLARTNGGGLELIDTREALKIRAKLPPTQDGLDTVALILGGVLRGLSLEFSAVAERMEGDTRVIERAELRGLAVVDRPAYSDSLVQARAEIRRRGRGIGGSFDYNRNRTTRATGRKRKQRVAPGAFKFALEDPDREISLLLGRNYDQPLASKLSGSLKLEDTREALRFDVDTLPDTSYVRDYRELVRSGAVVFGVDALFQIPPLDVVPNAVKIVPDTENPEVEVEVVSEAVLTALAVVTRQPRRCRAETKKAADMAVSPWPLLSPWPTTPAALAAATTALAAAVGSSEAVAGRLGPVVSELVERYASGAPAAVKSESVIRAAGWLHGNKPGLRKVNVRSVDIEFSGGQSALRHSGAMSLLSPFKIRRAGAI